jgi:hypothetical protein
VAGGLTVWRTWVLGPVRARLVLDIHGTRDTRLGIMGERGTKSGPPPSRRRPPGRVTSVGLLRRNSYGNLGAFLPADGCFYGHPGALPVNVARR